MATRNLIPRGNNEGGIGKPGMHWGYAGFYSGEFDDLSVQGNQVLTGYDVTEVDVTNHQAALSITESQISDLGGYITGYDVTEDDVTSHQAALSITESQISDLGAYITDYDVTQSDVTDHQAALSIGISQISDITISSPTNNQTLAYNDTSSKWENLTVLNGAATLIVPFGQGYISDITAGQGAGLSWGAWNATNGNIAVTFNTAQPNTNYSVTTDNESADDIYISVANKTTAGFTLNTYDTNGNPVSPSTYPFSFQVWASDPAITVGGVGAANIGDLADVDTTTATPTDGQALVWDSSLNEWKPADAGATTLDGLSDVSASSPTTNHVLTWGGSNWTPQAAQADVQTPLTIALRGTDNPHIGAYPNQSFKVTDNPNKSAMIVSDADGNVTYLLKGASAEVKVAKANGTAVRFALASDLPAFVLENDSGEPDIEVTDSSTGEKISVISGDSDTKGANGLPIRQGYNLPDIGANQAPLLISGGTIA